MTESTIPSTDALSISHDARRIADAFSIQSDHRIQEHRGRLTSAFLDGDRTKLMELATSDGAINPDDLSFIVGTAYLSASREPEIFAKQLEIIDEIFEQHGESLIIDGATLESGYRLRLLCDIYQERVRLEQGDLSPEALGRIKLVEKAIIKCLEDEKCAQYLVDHLEDLPSDVQEIARRPNIANSVMIAAMKNIILDQHDGSSPKQQFRKLLKSKLCRTGPRNAIMQIMQYSDAPMPGSTLLHFLCAQGRSDILQCALRTDHLHLKNEQGLSPLLCTSIVSGTSLDRQFKIFKALIMHPDFDINKEPDALRRDAASQEGEVTSDTPGVTSDAPGIISGVASVASGIIATLNPMGESAPPALSSKRYDALILAYMTGNTKLVEKVLQDRGIQENLGITTEEFHEFLFDYLVRANKIDKITELLKSGAMTKSMLNKKMKFSAKGSDGKATDIEATPLSLAIQTKNYELLKILLGQKGVDLTEKTNGATALQMAVITNDEKMVEMLLSSGKDVGINLEDKGGLTAYQIACCKAKEDVERRKVPSEKIRKMLMHQGANLDPKKPSQGLVQYMKDNYSWALSLVAYSADAADYFNIPVPGIKLIRGVVVTGDVANRAFKCYQKGKKFLYTGTVENLFENFFYDQKKTIWHFLHI